MQVGCDPRSLDGILLTHAHSDHLRGARELSDRYSIPIYATAGTLGHRHLRDSPWARPLEPGREAALSQFQVLAFRVPHDCAEPVGFRLSHAGSTVCLTTDLGFVPDDVATTLEGADLLVIEANHDEAMLWNGPYPSFLKRRVAGDCGHLSNAAAAACIARMTRFPPREVWLAHLSQVNNRVGHALEVVRQAISSAGLDHILVRAAARNSPSLRWASTAPAEQLTLF
jgi:phosphoribosyl 1,2-cyclic phosphodiesterase